MRHCELDGVDERNSPDPPGGGRLRQYAGTPERRPAWLVGEPAVAVAGRFARRKSRVRPARRLLLDPCPVPQGGVVDRVGAPFLALRRSRAPTASTRHGELPAPTMWFVPGGQCTKSHCRSVRSSPSMMRTGSPDNTRKSFWSASQWYMAIGSPGPRSVRLTPSCWKSVSPSSAPSKSHNTPRPGRCQHSASRALRTNQPSPFGTRPRSVSTSCA
jgi:hypothetical protein